MKSLNQLIITLMACLFSIQAWAQSGKLFNTDNQLSSNLATQVWMEKRQTVSVMINWFIDFMLCLYYIFVFCLQKYAFLLEYQNKSVFFWGANNKNTVFLSSYSDDVTWRKVYVTYVNSS